MLIISANSAIAKILRRLKSAPFNNGYVFYTRNSEET
jgi:hypothetical protein